MYFPSPLPPPQQGGAVALFICTLVAVFATRKTGRRRLQHYLHRCVSSAINWILLVWFPIKHVETGQPLPTCPYEWPNGQGNIAKFLDGLAKQKEWGGKYGSIYRIWSGTASEIVLTQTHHVRSVFRDSDRHIKAPNNNSGYFLGQILGECLGLISGSDWRAVKQAVQAPFVHLRMKDHTELVIRRTRSYLGSQSMLSKLGRGELDAAEDFKMLPFFIVAEILFGPLDAGQEEQLKQLAVVREELFRTAIRGGLVRFSFAQYLPFASIHQLRSFKIAWAQFVHGARQRNLNTSVPIHHMLAAVERGTIGEEQLLQTLDEMLFANLDVTMGGISWALVLIATHQEEQERLVAEVRQRQDDLEVYLLDSSSLLAATILESARLKPLAAFSVPQSAPTDRVLDGYLIPAYTSFIIDSHALNRDETFWEPDAARYRPDRFRERSTNTSARYHYWRFGFGPRQCVGKYIAGLMIRALLVCLLQDVKLENPQGTSELDRIEGNWINQPQGKLRVVKRAKAL